MGNSPTGKCLSKKDGDRSLSLGSSLDVEKGSLIMKPSSKSTKSPEPDVEDYDEDDRMPVPLGIAGLKISTAGVSGSQRTSKSTSSSSASGSVPSSSSSSSSSTAFNSSNSSTGGSTQTRSRGSVSGRSSQTRRRGSTMDSPVHMGDASIVAGTPVDPTLLTPPPKRPSGGSLRISGVQEAGLVQSGQGGYDSDQPFGSASSAGRTKATASDSASSLRHGSASGTPVGGVSLCRYEKTHARRMLHSSPLATPTPSGFTPTGGTPTLTPVTGVAFMDLLKDGSNPFALVDSLHLAPISESKTSATAGLVPVDLSTSDSGFPSLPKRTEYESKDEERVESRHAVIADGGSRKRPAHLSRKSVSDVYGEAAVAKSDFAHLSLPSKVHERGGASASVTIISEEEYDAKDSSPAKNAMPIGKGKPQPISLEGGPDKDDVEIEDEAVEDSFEDDEESEEDSDWNIDYSPADEFDIRNKVDARSWPPELLKKLKLPKSVTSWVTPLNCGNGIVDSRFKKIRELGSGVSGTVWQVSDRNCSSKEYALKSIPRSKSWALDVFEGEAKFLSHIEHPGIIRVCQVCVDDSHFHILTELGATDLFKRVKRLGRLPSEEVRHVLQRTLECLSFLHENNIVHRDIKPENTVFLSDDWSTKMAYPKMIDFGDALVVTDGDVYKEFVGTQCYLAPERFRGHKGWELKASDVWAVGVMAFEISTGKRCFYGRDKAHVTQKIEQGVWKYPRDLKPSELVCHFIESVLITDDKQRPTAEYLLKHPLFTADWNLYQTSKDYKKTLLESLRPAGSRLRKGASYYYHYKLEKRKRGQSSSSAAVSSSSSASGSSRA